MKQLANINSLKDWRRSIGTGSVGFVPTMGALHAGHGKLIEQSCAENEKTLVSIFVNPTQFNDQNDCATYPQPLKEDLELCEKAGVDAVFLPQRRELYPDNYTYRVIENEESTVLEGESRPEHFDGVLTVVMKLLILANANKAYFGEKDWQQLKLVRGMAGAYFLDTEVVGVPTVREEDGLALSSRNVRLSASARMLAPEFHRVLSTAMDCAMARLELESLGFDVEYVDERDGRRLGAVQLEGVRLIDNVQAME
ncbi:pantoate--beta-alanine ligase [Puniceicoccales bacterium CK1056]|uniref:Pantothenate synthetase n=2 Tax=Oceanipulchritudo coccoides TaxID=2706888 RepID=A0A6B2M2K3_9BACT|nr:pantoate--beta-alanine ligase [Oceanipulchritudo coccoides]NDV62429.1 pantoate--beta-alanine ligase [Oceanipulchritudo coccoides]